MLRDKVEESIYAMHVEVRRQMEFSRTDMELFDGALLSPAQAAAVVAPGRQISESCPPSIH